MKKIFSGIQPSGVIHIGNYFGAIKQWVDLQHSADEAIFCIVDLHAITMPQDPVQLRENIIKIAAVYLAAGIDPKKSQIFVQSTRPEHTELAWILNCNLKMGELYRMTQFKEKAEGKKDQVSAGLFDYPALMAADILIYQTTHVPVGDDQKQHIELTRNLADRFNKKYGQTFIVPKPIIKSTSARIMSLDNPNNKMSKSALSPLSYIAFDDKPEEISKKIKRAVTDSENDIKSDIKKPAISSLLNIYSESSGESVHRIEEKFRGKSYEEFKEKLSKVLIDHLKPVQERYFKLLKDKKEIENILIRGSKKIAPIAQKTVRVVKQKVGLGI